MKVNINSERIILGICMLLSLIFWLLVKLSQDFSTDSEVAIEYLLPDGFSFAESPPRQVVATMEGSGWEIVTSLFRTKDKKIIFNLPDNPSFTLNSSLLINKIQQEFRTLSVEEIDLDYILINLQPTATKKVPIYLASQLNFAPQHQQKGVAKILPDSVIINGPSGITDTITAWYTSPIIKKNLKSSFSEKVPLQSPENQEIRFDLEQVFVKIDVEQTTQKDLFVPVRVENGPDSLKIFPPSIKISFSVGLSDFDSISSNDFVLTADFKPVDQDPNNNTLPIYLKEKPNAVKNVILGKQSVEYFEVKGAEN